MIHFHPWQQLRGPQSGVQWGGSPAASERGANQSNHVPGLGMTTRQNDTVPNSARPSEGAAEHPTDPGPQSSGGAEDQAQPPTDALPVSLSEAKRMDEMLRSLARRRVMVPNSLEPGTAYQAEHVPAAKHNAAYVEPLIALDIPTNPPSSDSRSRTTVANKRWSMNRSLVWTVVGVVLVAAGSLFAIAFGANSTNSATEVSSPRSAATTPSPETPSVHEAAAAPLPAPSSMPPPRIELPALPSPRDALIAPRRFPPPPTIRLEPARSSKPAASRDPSDPDHNLLLPYSP
jgi:hypothetical protein